MRVLVTGATGFIGRHLVPVLAKNHEVFAVVRGEAPSDLDGATWVSLDLARDLDIGALPDSIDAVVHLAQSLHYREFPERADDIFAVNVQGTFRLLEYARIAGASRFVFTSTGGVYGHGQEHISEHEHPSPIDFYMRSKYAAEILAGAYDGSFVPVILRLFFVYGPGQKRMLMPTLLEKVRRCEEVVVQGNPGLRINPIYVSDAVRVFEPALALGEPMTVNVAGDEPVTLTELVSIMGKACAQEPIIRHGPAGQSSGDLLGDNARMHDLLGVSPRVPLYEGLSEMVSGRSGS